MSRTLYQSCVCMSVVLYNIHYTASTWLLRVSLNEKEFFEFMLEHYFSIGSLTCKCYLHEHILLLIGVIWAAKLRVKKFFIQRRN